MTSTATRLLIVAALLGVIQLGVHFAKAGLSPDNVVVTFHLADMPKTIGDWRGTDISHKIDPEVLDKLKEQAAEVFDIQYENLERDTVTVHSSLFVQYGAGVYHSPLNCYSGNGWEVARHSKVSLGIEDQPDASIIVTEWKKDGQHIMVGHWYQLDDQVILSRTDLGWARMGMARKESAPPLLKALLQTVIRNDRAVAEEHLLDVARGLYQWTKKVSAISASAAPKTEE